MILDQIREVPLTLTHRYSCPGILNSNRWLSTKGILAKEQEALFNQSHRGKKNYR